MAILALDIAKGLKEIIRMDKKMKLSPETRNAQALHQIDAMSGGLTPAIHPSSTFLRDENYELINARHSYGRDENPGFDVAEKVLADLEGAPAALLFSSGMAAAMAVVQSLSPGDQIVAPKVMYWGLRNWLVKFCDHWGLGLDLFDAAGFGTGPFPHRYPPACHQSRNCDIDTNRRD